MMFGAHYLMPEWSYSFHSQRLISRIFLTFGVIVAFSGIIHFRMNGTTVDPRNPQKATKLVQNGVYRYTRNPMYLGMVLVLSGGAVRVGNPLSVIGIVFLVWYLTRFQIKPEEDALKNKFGDVYLQYRTKVRRWV